MALVCILRHILGEDWDLLYDTASGEKRRCDGPPGGVWVLGDRRAELSIDILAELSGMEVATRPDGPHVKAFDLVASGSSVPIRWGHGLPEARFRSFVSQMLESIRGLLSTGCVTYYTDVFRRTRECLGALGHARINLGRLEAYRAGEANETNRTALDSFRPGTDGFAEAITYSQTSTVTGRLIVEHGPRILTLPKRYRDIIVPEHPNGKIFALDYKSLEPRVVLLAMGREPPDDIYAHVADDVLQGRVNRDQAKATTISLLYGASEKTVEQVSGLHGADLRLAMDGVAGFLRFDELMERLLAQVRRTDTILNGYGRPVKAPDRRKLLNYYSQSTAVEVVLLGFWGVIQLIRREGWRIKPVGCIHDAMLFDAHPDFVGYIERIRQQAESVEGYEARFPVKCEEIHCSTTAS